MLNYLKGICVYVDGIIVHYFSDNIQSSYVFAGVSYGLFSQSPSGDACHVQKFFISFCIFLTLAVTVLSISGFAEYGALLPSAVVYNKII